MRKMMWLVFALAVAAAACSKGNGFEIPAGSDVTVQKQDGVTVSGRLIEVKPDHVIVESNGVKVELPRRDIKSVQATRLAVANQPQPETERPTGGPSASGATATMGQPRASDGESRGPGPAATEGPSRAPLTPAAPAYREVTIPAGTVLPVALGSSVASDTSNVEDPVRGTLRRAVRVDGVEAIPAGTAIAGHVVSAKQSARVKGRASVAFRFNRLAVRGDDVSISTATVSHVAPGTKKQDAAKIGVGAAGGAIIGGIVGGGDGAAKGAAIGGGAGTGVVLSTRGKEVRLGAGTPVSVRLTAPVTLRVPVR